MLTRLRLRNWRSVKEETIDFTTPITVFIGANSSGKTNILDALHFLRYASTEGNRGIVGAIRYKWGGREKIQTVGSDEKEPVEIEFSFGTGINERILTQTFRIEFTGKDSPFLRLGRQLKLDKEIIADFDPINLPITGVGEARVFTPNDSYYRQMTWEHFAHVYVRRRWQLLKENFAPALTHSLAGNAEDLFVMDGDAHNLPFILDTMRLSQPNLYKQLQDDFRWLVSHVRTIDTSRDENEIKILIREAAHPNLEAPSISGGTGRILAILTAYYALDMDFGIFEAPSGEAMIEGRTIRINEMPGLIVIEEPDTALNPGLLQRFVGQLRNYTEQEDHPRQFVLTTHNPALLDFFEPEEVRVVECDEQGYTRVRQIPDYIKDIWLDKYALGEVWTTNSFGGLPE